MNHLVSCVRYKISTEENALRPGLGGVVVNGSHLSVHFCATDSGSGAHAPGQQNPNAAGQTGQCPPLLIVNTKCRYAYINRLYCSNIWGL